MNEELLDLLFTAAGNSPLKRTISDFRQDLADFEAIFKQGTPNYLEAYPAFMKYASLQEAAENFPKEDPWDIEAYYAGASGAAPEEMEAGSGFSPSSVVVYCYLYDSPAPVFYRNFDDACIHGLTLAFAFENSIDTPSFDLCEQRFILGTWLREADMGLRRKVQLLSSVMPADHTLSISCLLMKEFINGLLQKREIEFCETFGPSQKFKFNNKDHWNWAVQMIANSV